MAVTKIEKDSGIKLTFSYGLDSKGKEILKSKSLAHVKKEASDDNIYEVSKQLTSLQSHTLTEVTRQDNAVLAE